jgi:CHAD domain-containing protein
VSYRLALRKPVAEEFRRIAVEQLELAAAGHAPGSASLHDRRKAVKRLRALLALFAPHLSHAGCRRIDRDLRAVNRANGRLRDSDVLPDIWEALSTRYALDRQAYARVGELLAAREVAALQDERTRAPDLARIGEWFAQQALPRLETVDLVEGAADVYRAARRAARRLDERASADAFHDWRKLVQCHWRHMSLLRNFWTEEMRVRVEASREISFALGRDHDLAVLQCRIIAFSKAESGLARHQRDNLAIMIQGWQVDLRRDALALADRLFAERTSDFADRLVGYAEATQRRLPRRDRLRLPTATVVQLKSSV